MKRFKHTIICVSLLTAVVFVMVASLQHGTWWSNAIGAVCVMWTIVGGISFAYALMYDVDRSDP